MEKTPPHLPPEILENIMQYLIHPQLEDTVKDVRNFRLISKAFADAGLRYLIRTIRLLRLPSSFDKVEQIANHPRARFYVEELICYGSITRRKCLLSEDKNHRKARIMSSDEDTIRLQKLVQRLPNLKTARLEAFRFEHRIAKSKFRRVVASRLGQMSSLGYDCEGFKDIDGVLDIFNDSCRLDNLILSRTDECMTSSLRYYSFRGLRRLSIHYAPGYFSDRIRLPLLWNTLEVFELRCFSLDHARMDLALPKNLKCLGLSRVEISVDYLPKSLDEVWLCDVKLHEKVMASWVDIFLHWPHNCTLYFTGHIAAKTDGYPWGTEGLTSWDQTLGSTLGQVLKEICSMPRTFPDDLREDLLRNIFERSIMTEQDGNYHIETGRIYVSREIAARYNLMNRPPVGDLIPSWNRL